MVGGNYCEVPQLLKSKIKPKIHKTISEGMFMLQKNTCPMASKTILCLQYLVWSYWKTHNSVLTQL